MPKYLSLTERPLLYILEGDPLTPKPCDDVLAWADWMADWGFRSIAKTAIPGTEIEVSTAFIGVDTSVSGPPRVFETIIFRAGSPLETFRYSTIDEARQQHEEICAMLNKTLAGD